MFRVLCRGGEGTKEGGITQWKKAGKPIPPIVLGTDDVGVFATNIYNEYCNLYCQLLYKKQWNSNEIMDVIREMDYNAKIYRFEETGGTGTCFTE